MTTTMATQQQKPRLHARLPLRRTWLNRIFALVYLTGIVTLLWHHLVNLVHSPNIISLALLLADGVLAFMWITHQSFRVSPVKRKIYPENLSQVVKEHSDYPAIDVIICTADPSKEPPMSVANTALSVLAYDYPMEKLTIYVSDDGGSQLTLFAFLEAAKFAKHWLPYCRKNNLVDRCPEVHFSSDVKFPETAKMKDMYEAMKIKVDNVVDRGYVIQEYITNEQERAAFGKWTDSFVRQDHPTVIQVLLESGVDKDVTGEAMPNLVYVSREKRKGVTHNFKAGALNALIRVSATMTNAPIILNLDCDMYSNDPKTPLNALCFHVDPSRDPKLGFVQFPQRFYGINKNDTYGAELRPIMEIDILGMDGLDSIAHMGTGCFFRRRVFFGGPSSFIAPHVPELNPDHVVGKSIKSPEILALAHHVAGCNFEAQTKWGSQMGFRYGCVVEDFFTGMRLHCEGWKSVLCSPKRAAFLGAAPMTLNDLLHQLSRWSLGLIEVGLSKYSPLTFGMRHMKSLVPLCYAHYAFWPLWGIPLTIYSLLPQLALLSSIPIFPKVSDSWFFLYVFLFLGAYGQDFLEFVFAGGSIKGWWNNQRNWLIKGVSCYPIALVEYSMERLGISSVGFNVTSKVVDDEKSKRYDQEMIEFGVESPLFVQMTTAAIINLAAFLSCMVQILRSGYLENLSVQVFISGFAVVNSWPIYEAMVLRTDKGKMPLKITLLSALFAWIIYLSYSWLF